MKSYPFHVVTGTDRGISYSSERQVGDLIPSQPLGQAQVRVFYNIANGNLAVSDHLWTFAELGEPVRLGYWFNSHVPVLNAAWRLPVSHFTPPASGANRIIFTEIDGHETPYTQNGDLYCAPGLADGAPYLHWQAKTSQWFWHHPKTHLSALYDKNGVLLERRDLWGNRTEYQYDKGLLKTIIGPSGAQYAIERVAHPEGTREETLVLTRPDGSRSTVQRYRFDQNGLLTLAEISRNGQDFDGAYQTTYTYSGTTPRLQLGKITQSDGTQMQWTYGQIASTEQKTLTKRTVPVWRVQQIAVGVGEALTRTDFTYRGNKITVSVGKGRWLADFHLDTQSRIQQVTQYTGDTGTRSTEITRYDYAAAGQLQTLIRPDGSRESWTYLETFGLVTQHERPTGQQTRYHYDIGSNNRPLLQTREEILSETQHSLMTHTVYERRTGGSTNPADEKDYHRYTITPMGRVTALEPSARGPVQMQRDYVAATRETKSSTTAPTVAALETWEREQNPQAVHLTRYAYDRRGLVQETRRYATVDSQGVGVEDTQMSVTTVEWNDAGQWERQVKQLRRESQGVVSQAETRRNFDSLERLLKSTDPLGQITATAYEVSEEKQYPTGVYAVTVTQPNGRIEKTLLNAQGDPILGINSVPTSDGDSPRQTTHWQPDEAGRISVIQHPDGTTTFQAFNQNNRLVFSVSATGLVTEYEQEETQGYQYDRAYAHPIDTALLLPPNPVTGEAIKAALKPSEENDRGTYRFYDGSRRLRFTVDAEQAVRETQYDSCDRTTAIIHYADPLTETQLNTLKTGQLISLTPDVHTDRCTSYYYDDDNYLIGEIDPAGWVTEFVLDGTGQVSQEIRYSTPNRTQPRDPDFKQMRPVSKPEDAIRTVFRNARGQPMVTVSPAGFVTTFTYDASTQRQCQRRFYNPVEARWYQNTRVCPPLPATHSEDQITLFRYDLLERAMDQTVSDGAAVHREWTEMGQLSLERQYDTRFSQSEGSLDSDCTRTTHSRYDPWDHRVQTAPPRVSQQLAENPAKAEEIWAQSSRRETYDEVTGLKLKSTNTLGKTTIYYYDQERRCVLSISPQGAVVRLFYNAFHDTVMRRAYINPLSTRDLAGLTGGFITDAVLKLLVADEARDIIQQTDTDKRGQKIRDQDPEGAVFLYAYNAFRELITEQLPVQGKTPSLTIQHAFNGRGQEIRTTRMAGEVTFTVTQQFENLYGQLTDQTDEEGALTQYSHDREGLVVEVINALGVISHRNTHDALRRPLTDTDAEGQTTRWTYHQVSRSRLESPPVKGTQVVTETNIFGETIVRIDALGHERHTAHGPDGQVTRTVNELGCTTTNDYDTESHRIRHVDPSGVQTENAYDDEGALVTETQQKAYRHRDLVTRTERDTFGRAIATTNPRGVITQQQFNQRSLVVKTVRDVGTDTQPGLQLTQQFTYNGQCTPVSLIQGDEKVPNQYAVAFQQDGFNRSIGKVVDPTGENPLKLTTAVQLNGVGRVISHTDAAGRTTLLFSDALGQKRFAVDADGGLMEWQYNDLQCQSMTRRFDTGLTCRERAALTAQTPLHAIETLAAAKSSRQDTVTYFYYDGNRRERFRVHLCPDPESPHVKGLVIEKRYNGANHLTQTIHYANPLEADDMSEWNTVALTAWGADHADPADRLTLFFSDEAGQLRFIIDPRGGVTEQRYDELGRVNGVIRYAQLVPPVEIAEIATGFSLDTLSADVAAHRADPTQDRVTYTVFNVFNKPDYLVQTTQPPQCAVTHYQHDEVGHPVRTLRSAHAMSCSAATDAQKLVEELSALTPDESKESGDRITEITWDRCDRVSDETDELGYRTTYQRDALDDPITRTDQAGFEWTYAYDRAKRLTAEWTPSAPIGLVKKASDGHLDYTDKIRSVKTVRAYDGVNNLLKKVVDADGDDPREVKATFSLDNQPMTLTVPAVEVDDPTQPAHLTIRPVTPKDLVTQTIYNPKRKKGVEINEKGGLRFWVYDALERLAYQVDPLGYVIGYTRNAFGDVTIEAHYATPLGLDFKAYATTGIPMDVLAGQIALIESDADRYTFYDRDKGGHPISTIRGISQPRAQDACADLKGVLFYYCPLTGSLGFYYAQTNQAFDAFHQVRRTAVRITPPPLETWAEKYAWYDASGKEPIATAEAVNRTLHAPVTYRVTRVIRNTFLQPVQEIQYAHDMDLNPETLSVAQLDEYLAHQTSPKDRIRQFEYDLKGALIAVSRVGVTRDALALGGQPPIAFQSYVNLTLTERYQHEGRGLKTVTTHECLPGQTPTQECLYYEGRGLARAHRGVTFTTQDEKGTLPITPLEYYGLNAHGQRVQKRAYLHGASSASIDPKTLPTPLLPDEKQDKEELKQTDGRGQLIAQQNANGHVEQMTHTETGQIARTYGMLLTAE